MANLGMLILCLLLGALFRRTGRWPAATPAVLNRFILQVSLPALALLHVHALRFDRSVLFAAAMGWILFGGAVLAFWALGRALRLDRRTTGALMLLGGMGNTSFVGLPLIQATYGKAWLGTGLVADQLGSFLILSTLGVLVAVVHASGEASPGAMGRRILGFPPFQALVLALCLKPLPFPEGFATLLARLGDTLSPLALFSVGFQLSLQGLRGRGRLLALGLGYKLLLGPLLVLLVLAGLCGGRGTALQVTLFEAAQAPMITAGILAVEHDLDPLLVNLLLGLGIPLSFLTLPLWAWALRGL
jgi:malate permease and related proteins